MKSMARAILFGGVIVATQAAVGDTPGLFGEGADQQAMGESSTYAEPQTTGSVASADPAISTSADGAGWQPAAGNMTAALAFPGSSDDAGNHLPARITYADLHANDLMMTAQSAFPGSADEAGNMLIAKVTYADLHLDKGIQVAQSTQDVDAGSN